MVIFLKYKNDNNEISAPDYHEGGADYHEDFVPRFWDRKKPASCPPCPSKGEDYQIGAAPAPLGRTCYEVTSTEHQLNFNYILYPESF